MLEEKFHLLEQKVTVLLSGIERVRKENAALRQELASTQEQTTKEIGDLRGENTRYQAQIAELEGDVEENGTKEEEIRERLRVIIERIDSIAETDDGA